MSGKGWWNSALSGLESRLDTILADDDPASAKLRAADADKPPVDKKLAVESRNASRSRPNSRLQDRLAKAVNKGSERAESRPRASSELPSRPESPALLSPAVPAPAETDAPPTTKDNESTTTDEARDDVQNPLSPPAQSSPTTGTTASAATAATIVAEQPTSTPIPTLSFPPPPSIVVPQTPSPRQSLDSEPIPLHNDAALPTVAATDANEPQDELSLQDTYDQDLRNSRDEIHSHLERIDALQSKLSYLSQQLAASAKTVSSDAEATPAEKKLADKDGQIAALMEEGQKLSKTEMKHLTTIKQMRVKTQEQAKEVNTLKQRLSKAERSIGEHSDRARRAEDAERSAQDKLKIVSKIEKDIEAISAEREEAGLTIAELRRQLNDALSRSEEAEKRAQSGALEAEMRVTASLREDLDNTKIEKKLTEDRAKRELQASQEEAKNQQEKAKVAQVELRSEIANLESRLELLRSRSEEATSSATGDSQATLLRQVETLQTQYSLASENWQGIETTLTSRISALEKDRDETAKRESDVRRKAREVNSKARRLEDELESINERARVFEQDLNEQRASAQKMQNRLAQAEAAAQDARMDLEREKAAWEAESQQRVDEEKHKWRLEAQSQLLLGDPNHLRTDSQSTSQRRHSPDPLGIYNRRAMPRSISGAVDVPFSPMDRMFDDAARRPSSARQRSTPRIRTPEIGTPQRQDSTPSSLSNRNGVDPLDTPSIHTIDHDDPFDNVSSPHLTINDMLSASTVGAGPSVQLVERMSAAVRRLESEKATHKEELSRLMAQRDEAREEVVTLMREVDEKRGQDERVDKLEKELHEMDERYQTTLEMLGEKTEKVEELEGDVKDLKKIYRELVQTMK